MRSIVICSIHLFYVTSVAKRGITRHKNLENVQYICKQIKTTVIMKCRQRYPEWESKVIPIRWHFALYEIVIVFVIISEILNNDDKENDSPHLPPVKVTYKVEINPFGDITFTKLASLNRLFFTWLKHPATSTLQPRQPVPRRQSDIEITLFVTS